MSLSRRPFRTRTLLCVLAFALWMATTLGLVHRTVHGSLAGHGQAGALAKDDARHAAHGLDALFADHTDADCRLYDQLSHGPAALCVPALLLPVFTLPAATFAWLEGEALARWVALFDARGPPSIR